ncbi:hypothetical protein [Streptomyces sp. NPDC048663]|uniref:hypothetical protein n=1 Tax=Streptomyces sp. NPDC048663 TaxID=3155638 RepID=UPI00341F233F
MSELPPDTPCLRAILTHPEKQIADTDTIGTYLRLQRGAVQVALSPHWQRPGSHRISSSRASHRPVGRQPRRSGP